MPKIDMSRLPPGYISLRAYCAKYHYNPGTVRDYIATGRLECIEVQAKSRTYHYIYADDVPAVERGDIVRCPCVKCRFNSEGQCRILTECLWDQMGGCPFFKPPKSKGDEEQVNTSKYNLNPAQRRIVKNMVADEIKEQMSDYLIKYDSMWLWTIGRELGWGKRRLERMYKSFYTLRAADKAFFSADGYEGLLENEAVKGLREMGIDIAALAKECGEPVVRTEVHN